MRFKKFGILLSVLLLHSMAFASVESSLMGLKTVLIGSILPTFAVMG